jgi:ABC-2 type transport system ATP-binding protein
VSAPNPNPAAAPPPHPAAPPDEVSFGRAPDSRPGASWTAGGEQAARLREAQAQVWGPGGEPATGRPEAAITARGLTKRFRGGQLAVDDLSLDVPYGSVYGFLGPNGSGKTTTIRMLLGLVHPTGGQHELLGEAMPGAAAAVLPRVGALVEGPAFYSFLSGPANLARLDAADAAADPRTVAGRIAAALDRVGLAAAGGKHYRAYSLGMKQRLGLAAALLVPRRLVVLDEPTNGLDPAGTRDVRRVIADLHAAGATVLVSSHLLAEVEAVCSHVAVLRSGSLLVSGELATLLDADAGGLVVTTDDVTGALDALRAAGTVAYRSEGGVTVPSGALSPPEVVAVLVRAGVGVWEVHRRRARLEEVFARLTETPEEDR